MLLLPHVCCTLTLLLPDTSFKCPHIFHNTKATCNVYCSVLFCLLSRVLSWPVYRVIPRTPLFQVKSRRFCHFTHIAIAAAVHSETNQRSSRTMGLHEPTRDCTKQLGAKCANSASQTVQINNTNTTLDRYTKIASTRLRCANGLKIGQIE